MSSQFDVPLNGFRYVVVQQDDTLQLIALRELGSAARWTELIPLNSLRPPFITWDATLAGPGVLRPGDTIMVPAAALFTASDSGDADDVLLTDVALVGGRLDGAGGDFAMATGAANLKQALAHVLDTDQGELMFHPDYGSQLRQLVGAVNAGAATLLAAQYAREAVAADPRVDAVTASSAQSTGDTIRVSVTARSILGRQVPVVVSL